MRLIAKLASSLRRIITGGSPAQNLRSAHADAGDSVMLELPASSRPSRRYSIELDIERITTAELTNIGLLRSHFKYRMTFKNDSPDHLILHFRLLRFTPDIILASRNIEERLKTHLATHQIGLYAAYWRFDPSVATPYDNRPPRSWANPARSALAFIAESSTSNEWKYTSGWQHTKPH